MNGLTLWNELTRREQRIMIKLFGGGSPLGDGPIETANLARLGLITMNGVNLGRPRAVHCCFQSATRCRSKNGEIKGSFRKISGLKRRCGPGAQLT